MGTQGARAAVLAALIAIIAALAATPALAATAKVSGKVKGGRGMTLAAVLPNGSAERVKLKRSGAFKFKLRRGRGVTLHLFKRSGAYHGPVLLGRKDRTGYATLSGRSLKVGVVRVKRGHAVARKPARKAAVNRRAKVKLTRRGVPVGAGTHGLVKGAKRSVFASQAGGGGGGSDSDGDGIPASLDLDSNGNGELDNFDSAAPERGGGFFSSLFTDMRAGLNVNATPGTDESAIDANMAGDNTFALTFYMGDPAGRNATAAHVDCGTLAYCRRGTGSAIIGGLADAPGEFQTGTRWADFTPDGSGYPNLVKLSSRDAWAMPFSPRATSRQIRPGDSYDVVFDTSGGDVHVPTSLTAYFVTTPALSTWGSGGTTTAVSYPVGDGPGTSESNPFTLTDGRLTLTAWRPQRQAIPGAERGRFIDQGGLNYGLTMDIDQRQIGCAGHYSALSSSLTERAGADPATQLTPLVDSAGDAAPDPARTIGWTVDLAGCLRSQGVEPAGRSFRVTLTAAGQARSGGMDSGNQMFFVQFP